jgi:hypothetical protein
MSPTHNEFARRSIDRSEVHALAARLAWPRCTYRGYAAVELEGRVAWSEASLSDPAARRDLLGQLLKIEHTRLVNKSTTK